MLNRKYSLKTRYNFRAVLNGGDTFHASHLIVKYLRKDEKAFEGQADKKFAVIASNRFCKKAVTQNKIRRMVLDSVRKKIDKFAKYYYYVFIPKKTLINENGKIAVDAKSIDTEIDTFLSEVDFS
ncbi:hypothetical protein A2982_03490 [candidate division WWE3 bacterium RIFCSPLOWO2_01_FULL_39_13]|uniref:Ribonuclease P protein component n=1 Tax=candidate division WWE3 bacterium RIFCSPLOWO2_01_FULL_39_13 TaxID=1802624 RepID=A0A1F4V3D7_UNCKA|nr:MAG: hypothetical protein A2982_03490 [candidate division WWE3 bacterium RIFCSPLOWO2_01_FULL_39_13]